MYSQDSKRENKKVSSDWVVPDYPPLNFNDCVGKASVEGQMYHYPKVVRSMRDEAIPGQTFALISFMYFKENRKFSNGKSVYGFTKIRGIYGDFDLAKKAASKIIREQDSKFQIRIAEVGAWVPLTEEEAFTKEQFDVRMNDQEVHLRDDAIKEKEARQRQIMREIREREEECKSGDVYDDPKSLRYYTMRRVTNNSLGEAVERQEKQLNTTVKTRKKVQKELKKLDLEYPEYKDQWVDCYSKERAIAGWPAYVPSEESIEEYENIKLESLDTSSDEEDELTETEKLRNDAL